VEFNYRIKGMKNVNDQIRFNACSTAHVSYMTWRERRTSATALGLVKITMEFIRNLES
jgi:hypothetical protein